MHHSPAVHHPWSCRRVLRLLWHSRDRLIGFMAYTTGSSIRHCVRSVNRLFFLLASIAEVAGLQRSQRRSQSGLGQTWRVQRRARERFIEGFSGAGWRRSCGSANNGSECQSQEHDGETAQEDVCLDGRLPQRHTKAPTARRVSNDNAATERYRRRDLRKPILLLLRYLHQTDLYSHETNSTSTLLSCSNKQASTPPKPPSSHPASQRSAFSPSPSSPSSSSTAGAAEHPPSTAVLFYSHAWPSWERSIRRRACTVALGPVDGS